MSPALLVRVPSLPLPGAILTGEDIEPTRRMIRTVAETWRIIGLRCS